MPGKLDEISRLLGSIEAGLKALDRRVAEDRSQRDREHAQNQESIGGVLRQGAERARAFEEYRERTDRRLSTLELLQPVVAGLQMTRARLVSLAAVGFAVIVVLGWIVEAGAQWAVKGLLSHWH